MRRLMFGLSLIYTYQRVYVPVGDDITSFRSIKMFCGINTYYMDYSQIFLTFNLNMENI